MYTISILIRSTKHKIYIKRSVVVVVVVVLFVCFGFFFFFFFWGGGGGGCVHRCQCKTDSCYSQRCDLFYEEDCWLVFALTKMG